MRDDAFYKKIMHELCPTAVLPLLKVSCVL